jgi:hypothetical protein
LGDRELEGVRKDTRHKIYTGSGRQGGEPYVLFGIKYGALRFVLGLVQVPGLVPGPPLYSPGGGFLVGYKAGVLVGLHGTSPNRITGEF